MTDAIATAEAHDHREAWDRADERELKRLVKMKKKNFYTWADIGLLLGRTSAAARHKAHDLGLKP